MEAAAVGPVRRRQLRRYALYGTAAVVAGGLAYKAYHSDGVAQTKQSLARLRLALEKYSDALSSGADLFATLVRDLQSFLQSDSTEVPGSLRQLAKLLQSQEVTQTTTKAVSAVYRGIAGEGEAGTAGNERSSKGAVDKVLEALLSDRGHSLVSVAVSMGARNMVAALVDANARVGQQQEQQQQQRGGPPPPGMVDKVLDFMGTERGQQLAVAAITAFVTNGMRVYMDATLDINFYEDIFSSMARPQHLEAVKQCIGMFAREAVGTAMQGSPQPPQRSSRPALIQELPPSSPHSPPGTPREQQQCPGDFMGSPLDSAFRGGSPTPLGEEGEALDDAASSVVPATLRQRRQQQQQGEGIAAVSADDLDSDSLLHARREGPKQPPQQQQQQQGAGPTWLPLVTREVLAVVKNPNARSVLVGAAGATAHEFGAAMVAGLGQLEVTRRWGTRGLLMLLLLTFLTVCLAQELLRAAVLTVLR